LPYFHTSMNDAASILQQYWGFSSFRPMQGRIIDAVLQGKDVLALLPTGGGKSLCYQVPALVFDGLTIVISPLIALMKDQVSRLQQLGIKAEAIYTGQPQHVIERHLDNAQFGKTKLLYISPERLRSEVFRVRLKQMDVRLIAVDEAHCISQWGHDFRPAYLEIATCRELFPAVPVIALTASATPAVKNEIVEKLLLKDPALFQDSFARPNLRYHVVHREDHMPYITRLVQKNKASAIIYVRHRRKAVELSHWLANQKLDAQAYHGGMMMADRDRIQEDWISKSSGIIVATNAFGMGVDKPDVRLVVHYDLPPGLEEYYQEAGRAGRDGNEAYCIIVLKPSAITQLRQRVEASFPSLEFITRVYRSLHLYLDIAVGTGGGEIFDFNLDTFCKRFDLKTAEAYTALDILAKESFISLDDYHAYGSTVQISTDTETLYQYQVAEPLLDLITKALLRGYEGLWTSPVRIAEKKIASHLQWEESLVVKQLQRLHNLGLITYRKPTAKSQVTLLQSRLPEQHFTIDEKSYAFRKDRALARMNTMIGYLGDDILCREAFIQSYFGEENAIACGHCDRCQQRSKIKPGGPIAYKTAFDKKGTTVKDFLAGYATEQQPSIVQQLRQLADEHKIVIKEDKIYPA
jgi:ATP-dependent DNA helicase RecQ